MAGNGISTVMMKGIFEDLAEGHQLPKRLGQELLSSMVERVTLHLRQGDRIRIGGLGTLEVRKREARTGRNPATGETMQIAASKKVAFRPAKGAQGSRLIPVALSGHRLGPVASGERGDPVGHSHELVPAVTTCVDDRLVAVPDAVAKIIAAHEFPDVFHRV